MRRQTCVIAPWGLFVALSCGSSVAADGQGLMVSRDAPRWSPWQGRVSIGNPDFWRSSLLDESAAHSPNLSLMGDYYFTRSLLGVGVQGGFRATSGLFVGRRGQAWTGQPGLGAGSPFSLGSRLFGVASATPAVRDPASETATLPYLGVGYTGLSLRGGWSFSADLGVIAQNPGSAIRLGRAFGSNAQSLDDLVRDLRMTPMFQLGVSYAF